jgi:THO complex subunit 1
MQMVSTAPFYSDNDFTKMKNVTEADFAACENCLASYLKAPNHANIIAFDSYNPEIITIIFKQKLLDVISDDETEPGQELFKSYLNFELLFKVLDLSIELSNSQETLQSLTFLLIEDLIDLLTVKNAEKIFDFIYSRFDKLSENLEPNKGKGLIILRICNEFLKRVSKLENAKTCGKILILLSQIFPISDQSGINKKGEFNVENKTVFHRDDDSMDVENETYNQFWELQFYFSNPTVLLEQSSFVEFEKRIDSVLTHLESMHQQTANIKTKRKSETKLSSKPDSFHFFPKYLTSKNLFELEVFSFFDLA